MVLMIKGFQALELSPLAISFYPTGWLACFGLLVWAILHYICAH
jgi:hypothetical protein